MNQSTRYLIKISASKICIVELLQINLLLSVKAFEYYAEVKIMKYCKIGINRNYYQKNVFNAVMIIENKQLKI